MAAGGSQRNPRRIADLDHNIACIPQSGAENKACLFGDTGVQQGQPLCRATLLLYGGHGSRPRVFHADQGRVGHLKPSETMLIFAG